MRKYQIIYAERKDKYTDVTSYARLLAMVDAQRELDIQWYDGD